MTDPRSTIPQEVLFNAIWWNEEKAEHARALAVVSSRQERTEDHAEYLRNAARYEANAEEIRTYIWEREHE